MMDPELMRLAQEQMSRISPADFARMQQQMMSNPDLMRMASESMKNMKPEDLKYAAEQFKHARPEEMAEIGEKMANASPEEIAAMRSRIDTQVNYELAAAQLLKKQGNELHSQGRFSDASEKYFLAKENLKGNPTSGGRTLQLACSLNLMSCYLKTRQYDDCINEGNEVLAYDEKNVKALYRRGQAYKELGQLEEAVSDLSKAHEVSPDDETITEILRDAREQLVKEGGRHSSKKAEDAESVSSSRTSLSADNQSQDANDTFNLQNKVHGATPTTNYEGLQTLKDDPEAIRSLQNFISNADPDSVAALEGGKEASPDTLKSATTMISEMSPDEHHRMVQLASSFEEQNPSTENFSDTNTNNAGPEAVTPNVTPEMLHTATDMLSKIPSKSDRETSEMTSSLEGQSSIPSRNYDPLSDSKFVKSESSSSPYHESPSSRTGPSQPNLPSSAVELHEQIRNQMRDPAMREMFTSMIKSMDPDMMADMSEQFGIKLSREDAIQAQKAMTSMSPERLDRMMSWAEKVQKGVNGVKKAKNHLLGRTGLILAICIVILAILLHQLEYIGR